MILEQLYNEIITGENFEIAINEKEIISKYDVRNWMEKILTSGKSIRNSFIYHSDIICKIFPELSKCIDFWQNNKYHRHNVYEHLLYVVDGCKTDDFIIKLAALFHDIGKPDSYIEDSEGHGHFYGHPEVSYEICKNSILNRIELTYKEQDRFLNLVRYHDITIIDTDKSVGRAYRVYGESFLRDWFILKQADLDDHIFPDKNEKWIVDTSMLYNRMLNIIKDEKKLSIKNLNINGTILKEGLGIPEGKQIGKILQTLFEEVRTDKLKNETDELILRAYELKDI